jgi:hypothetical protein
MSARAETPAEVPAFTGWYGSVAVSFLPVALTCGAISVW